MGNKNIGKIRKKVMSKVKNCTHVPTDWNADSERLILFADIMGFKDRVINTDHKKLKEDMEAFHDKLEKQSSPLRQNDKLKFAQFSDSILVVANGTDESMFNLISKAAARLMHVALSEGIAIKGVIAQGKFTYDKKKELYIGKPLVDAYLLHDEIKFYGIVVHHSAEKTVKLYASENRNPYTNLPVTLEKGQTAHYHLCWNMIDTLLAANDITDECNNWLANIAETVSGRPRIYIDNTLKILKADQDEITRIKAEKGTTAATLPVVEN